MCFPNFMGWLVLKGLSFLFITSNSQAAIQALSSRDPPLDVSTHWYRGAYEGRYEFAWKRASTPLVGMKPFCDLGDDYFKEELKRLIAAMSDRIWKNTETLRQYKYY